MKKNARIAWAFVVIILAALPVRAADLQQSFINPPDESKPLTWWHWIDGNVTKKGISGDMEAMKQAGIGGCYLFSIGGFFPKGPAVFGTPGWYDLLTHAANEAERLGLQLGVHNCDGWSQSGGPWIKPETSMKELTYSRADVQGPREFDDTLAVPEHKEGFYRDIAYIAFPIPAGERQNNVTASGSGIRCEALSDNDVKTRADFPVANSGHRVELALPEARVVRSLILHNMTPYAGDEDLPVALESSMDGRSWRAIGNFTLAWDTADGTKTVTVALDELNTRFLRLSFTNQWEVAIGEIELSNAAKLHFAEAKAGWLRTRGHGGESRHFARYPGPDRQRAIPGNRLLSRDQVIVLPSPQNGGKLKWKVPEGRWRILRLGYTTNGRTVKPATDAGRGLECDKLDPKVVQFHMEQYVGRLAKLFGAKTGKVFRAVETDSWECDVQNWTAGLETRFEQNVGFDLLPWVPLMLEGWIMENADRSERMLWDWRRFLADQLAENYFAEVSRFLKERDLTYVIEGSGRQMYLYDAIGYQRAGDVPMGEFWLNPGASQGVRVDNKVAASAAHITGRKIVASESYTASAPYAKWQNHPYSLKPMGDKAFCAGVNQFVFHTFAHQPYDVTGPGFTMAVWGLNCNRANTWWEPGKAWMQYLARCNHLLREGQFAADVLWFVGEDVPNRIGWRDELVPALSAGYDFDGCDGKALLQASFKDGRIVLPSGTQYRVLLLANKDNMRPAVLRKVAELVKAGAVVVGPRPVQSPSLSDLEDGDAEVQRLSAEVWGACDGETVKEHTYGKGNVYWGLSFPEVFERIGLAPDFDFEAVSTNANVIYIHRQDRGMDLYFVANQQTTSENITATFRVSGRQPEIWDPVTGEIRRPGVFKEVGDGIEMPLSLDPAESVFVVFRNPLPERFVTALPTNDLEVELLPDGALRARAWSDGARRIVMSDGAEFAIPALTVPRPLELSGPWSVAFPPGLGAPAQAAFEKLLSWPQRSEPGIKHFSGTATYTKQFDLEAAHLVPGQEIWLDLGNVQVIAQVRLNEKEMGILWKPPFRLNATAALKAGKNLLEVKVTNLWPNRMIGDEQFPDSVKSLKKRGEMLPAAWPDWLLEGKPRPDGRITFCTRKPYKAGDPLLDSGLIGPVRLVTARVMSMQ